MHKNFSYNERIKNINSLSDQDFDLVIVGGGINGAGAARDAALRGMKVALIEANDFASGTSSRSSKLVHGGIRYLENLEFGLVFEALSERQKLFEIAPHLVHPLRFLLPLYEKGRVGMLKMSAGMWLYDILSLFQADEPHARFNKTEVLDRVSVLNEKELLGAYEYSDAYMDDDRLVIETLRSAHEAGAVIVNYVQAKSITKNLDGSIASVKAEDILNKNNFEIKGKYFLSTVGPWTDDFGFKIDPSWKKVLRPTKGVHLVFAKDRIEMKAAVVMAAEQRIVFAIPRKEMIIIGTTDTDYNEAPENVRATKEDIDYLLQVANQYFPGANLTKKDIISAYAGVRPLVKDEAAGEGKTSREHSIWSPLVNLIFVAGGKYTTYRLIAQQAVDKVLEGFSIEDRVRFGSTLSEQPLFLNMSSESYMNREGLVVELQKKLAWTSEEIRLFVDRHGVDHTFLRKMNYWQAEADYAIEKTMCLSLVDFYYRRTSLFLAHRDHGLSHLSDISAIFKEKFNWDAHEEQKQIENLKKTISLDLNLLTQ